MPAEPVADLAERFARAESLVKLGHYPDAAAELQGLLATGDRCPQRPRVLLLAAQVMMARGELGAAQQTVVEAREAAVAAGDEAGQLQALGTLGQILRRDGEVEGAVQVARDGRAIARRMGERTSELTFAGDESRALAQLGDGDGALAAARYAVELARDVASPIPGLRTSGWLATLLIDLGRTDEARAMAEGGLARSRKAADVYGEASFLDTLADIADAQGRYQDALDARRSAVHVGARSGQWGLLVSFARRFVLHFGRLNGGHPYLWLAARSMTITAILCGDELRPQAMHLAVRGVVDGIRSSPVDEAVEGLDMVCALIRPVDPPDDRPAAPPVLEAAVTVVARWWFGHPADDLPVSATELDDALGTAPALAGLVTEPSPYAGRQ